MNALYYLAAAEADLEGLRYLFNVTLLGDDKVRTHLVQTDLTYTYKSTVLSVL